MNIDTQRVTQIIDTRCLCFIVLFKLLYQCIPNSCLNLDSNGVSLHVAQDAGIGDPKEDKW